MYKYVFAIVACVSLVSCSSGSDSASDAVNEVVEAIDTAVDSADGSTTVAEVDDTASVNVVVVTGDGDIQTINSEIDTDLTVIGTGHTVSIETNLVRLVVGGANNLLIFSENISVDECEVGGTDNTGQIPESVSIDCVVGGPGNSGF